LRVLPRPRLNPKPRRLHLYLRTMGLPPHQTILSLLKADESTHIDELIEKLESEILSSEIFPVRSELAGN
jgi:hypothetical protein